MAGVNLQKPTNTELVPAAYYDIFALKILGEDNKKIAQQTGYSEQWIRYLFCSKGALHDLYRSWVDSKKKDNLEEVFDIINGNLPDIIRARAMHAKSFVAGSVESSKLLLAYVLGDPSAAQTNVQINNIVVEPERKELIMNAFKNFGLIKEETNVTSKSNTNKRPSRSDNKRPGAKKGKR